MFELQCFTIQSISSIMKLEYRIVMFYHMDAGNNEWLIDKGAN